MSIIWKAAGGRDEIELIPVLNIYVVVVQSPSHDSLWPHGLQQARPLTISQSLPKFMFITSVMSSHLILWCSLLLPLIFPSIKDFSNESSLLIRWPKYWSFNFSISPSNEIFRVDPHLDCLVWSPCCPRKSINVVPQKGRCFTNLRQLENTFILLRNFDSSMSEKYFSHGRCVWLVKQAGPQGMTYTLETVGTMPRAHSTFRASLKCFPFHLSFFKQKSSFMFGCDGSSLLCDSFP